MEPISNAQLLQQMVTDGSKTAENAGGNAYSTSITDLKTNGVSLPTYSSLVDESAQLHFKQVDQYFCAHGLAWKSKSWVTKILVTLGVILRGAASQWFAIDRSAIATAYDFFIELDREFLPEDLQQRLRDQLNDLQQRNGRDISDYIARHRHIMAQIRSMSEIDKVIHFQRGSQHRTREEVQYRR